MSRLQDKVALITGGAQGIGLATAQAFVDAGARVYIADIEDDIGRKAAEMLGTNAEYLSLDVGEETQWKETTALLLQKHECLDIVVNNAGITGFTETSTPQDPEHFELAAWHSVHKTNLDGVSLGCKYAIAMLKNAKSASIVNISSRSGMVGIPGAAAYASSKAAVRNHSKTVALYCAQQGYPIRCNSVHPGAILTPMWNAMLGEGEQRKAAIDMVAQDIPLQTMGTPEDVAYAVLYLASDEAKYVTGIELTVDGGILAGATAAPKKSS
ncbi:SDR family oxidoreductase [Aliiglaciecola sp. 3_MG-2023]|uniref:SDR family oxidoreductase n=1 Tax=Aliiglaciecola sp. 3_MG-2023 TaxID=3062644 RepID=UPI0026E12591|nr:SDR family oxidoreductase [Aliiglaciecola sp. 3_MG-2023]MDO6695425.1 SDR family oxidoreductase [Aliiglaciecola sp. 3_MG-2023]